MKKIFILYASYFALLTSCLLYAAFDNVGFNARPQGMGDVFTSISDDINSVYYNPAGIAKVNNPQIIFSYRDFYNLGLLTQNYLGFSVSGRFLNTAFSVHRIATTQDVDFLNYVEDIYAVTLAGKVANIENLFAGINFKFYRVFTERNASGYGIDTGILYKLLENKFGFGLMLQNVNNPEIVWDTGVKDTLDFNFRLGISYMPVNDFTFAIDYAMNKLNFGIELWFLKNTIGLRGGIKDLTNKDKTFATGLSLNFGKLQFDYALTKHYSLGWTQFFTLMIRMRR